MKSGYNPVRRNRNIGTAKQGRGRTNRLTIPLVCNAERIWWENLGPHTVLKRVVGRREITFVIEQTREGYVHACTVDDVWHLLSLVPATDLESLDTVVMRQSTRKQALVNPAWGRLAYAADFGQAGHQTIRSGPALFLEATDPTRVWKWSRNLCPEDSLELERLRNDGHSVDDAGKRFVFRSTLESNRATQLYRTLLHEVGHWVDWLEKVVRPAADDFDLYSVLSHRYFARTGPRARIFRTSVRRRTSKPTDRRRANPFQNNGP
jgi:hypothetical protein